MDQPTIDTKSLFAPKKGKQATKGQKEIYKGNKETILFYSIWAGAPVIFKLALRLVLSYPLDWLLFSSIIIQACSVGGLIFMAKPVVSGSSNTVVDGGTDLNLRGGFADYLKDLIVTTAFCTAMSVFSSWFWLVLLWWPIYIAIKIWNSVIAPWIFAPAPEVEPEVADKKRKKMERKMARAGYR